MVCKVIDKNIADSARDFKNIVWPEVAEWLGSGELIPAESVTDSYFCKILDMYSGIDAWQVVNNKGIRGIASRVQWGEINWKTWTIRYEKQSGAKTEYHRLMNLDTTLLKPSYHIQAYINKKGGELMGVACIKTEDLISMLTSKDYGSSRPNPEDGTLFLPVYWDRARELGFDVFIYPDDSLAELNVLLDDSDETEFPF